MGIDDPVRRRLCVQPLKTKAQNGVLEHIRKVTGMERVTIIHAGKSFPQPCDRAQIRDAQSGDPDQRLEQRCIAPHVYLESSIEESPVPLFLCPNDNETMKKVERDGVEFDICPTCRGVWLDRGELEKLISADRGAETAAPPPQAMRERPAPQREYPPERSYKDARRDDDDDDYRYRHKKRRGFDLFDIFD